jgi:hypothetical protein
MTKFGTAGSSAIIGALFQSMRKVLTWKDLSFKHKTGKASTVCEVQRSDVVERRGERGKRGIRGLCVRRVCFDEKVDILSYSGAARER